MALHGVKTKFIIFVIATTSPTVILPAATKERKPKLSNKERYALREAAPEEFKKKKFRNKEE